MNDGIRYAVALLESSVCLGVVEFEGEYRGWGCVCDWEGCLA